MCCILASGRMGQRLIRLGLRDQTRKTAGGSQTGGYPGARLRPWAVILCWRGSCLAKDLGERPTSRAKAL